MTDFYPRHYPRTVQRIGKLVQEDIVVVHMSRARFLELIDKTLDLNSAFGPERQPFAALRSKIWPVAEQMTTFPFLSWVNYRGCGCLVGEYLIAADLLDRKEYAGRNIEIHRMLPELDDGDRLRNFGVRLDRLLQKEIGYVASPAFDRPDAIVID